MSLVIDKIENELIEYWKEDGILFANYKIPIVVGMDHIDKVINLRHKISKKEKQYLCGNINNVIGYTESAQIYADKFGQELLHACAVFSDSYLGEFVTEKYNVVYPPKIPMKLFKNKEEAVQWLKEIKELNERNN